MILERLAAYREPLFEEEQRFGKGEGRALDSIAVGSPAFIETSV